MTNFGEGLRKTNQSDKWLYARIAYYLLLAVGSLLPFQNTCQPRFIYHFTYKKKGFIYHFFVMGSYSNPHKVENTCGAERHNQYIKMKKEVSSSYDLPGKI
jgi:hypothetical protein